MPESFYDLGYTYRVGYATPSLPCSWWYGERYVLCSVRRSRIVHKVKHHTARIKWYHCVRHILDTHKMRVRHESKCQNWTTNFNLCCNAIGNETRISNCSSYDLLAWIKTYFQKFIQPLFKKTYLFGHELDHGIFQLEVYHWRRPKARHWEGDAWLDDTWEQLESMESRI